MAPIYFLRCQCHLASFSASQATADVGRFRKLIGANPDKQEVAAVAQLERQCRELVRDAAEFTEAALQLKAQAIRAFREGDTDRGLELVRQAALACSKPSWRQQLSKLLNGGAVEWK